jgi:glycosyltransferase involved in cell wall biosynthesis
MRILHAIHDFLPRHRAGSEIHALQLCRALQPRHHVQVLCAEYDPSRRHGSLACRDVEGVLVNEVVNNWAFRGFRESWQAPSLTPALEQVLDEVRPDVLHVHNLLNLSLELPALARRRGIAVVATLHDYTLFCPSGGQRVHLAEEHVCESIDSKRCARCFRQSPFHAQMAVQAGGPLAAALVVGGRALKAAAPRAARLLEQGLRLWPADGVRREDIEERLAAARAACAQIDRIVAPSQSLAEECVKLGVPEARIEVSDYGFPPLQHQGPVPRGGPLRIGFVGTLAWHKGAHVLVEACRMLPAGAFRLLIFGNTATFPAYVADLRRAAEGLPVEFRGPFDEAGAPRAYGELDMLVVSSLWPENSPLVIHEAFQAGVPVVGARMGGIVGLLGGGRIGPLYEARSPWALAGELRALIEAPSRLAGLAAGLPRVKTIDEDAREWERRYQGARA